MRYSVKNAGENVEEFIKKNFEPVEDEPGYVWFNKRNFQIISIETLAKSLKSFEDGLARDLNDSPLTAVENTDGDLISRDFMEKLGATCIAKRNETGELVAISSIDNLPSVEQTALWIPISERLPELGIDVLICDIDGSIYLSHRSLFDSYFSDTGDKIKNIRAWMPIPEPYKESEEEE